MNKEKDSSFRKAFQHLKLAAEYFSDFKRENPNSIGAKSCRIYGSKIDWCLNDFKTCIDFPPETLEDFLKEMEDDPLALNEIGRLANLLSTQQKEALEKVLTILLSGEEVTVVLNRAEENK